MKTKLVLWGADEADNKVLIAMQLRPKDNKVDIWTFPESIATEDFGKQMLTNWRNDEEVLFPEGHTHLERELTVSESLLPETLKVERGDIVQRAQTEWHFIVLSSKLNEVYQSELGELKAKVDSLTDYDSAVWESLKSFWSKVQEQVRDRNLFREHANVLRDNTNELFNSMKGLRASLDKEFQKVSAEQHTKFMSSLADVEERIKKDQRLSSIFDELKSLQRKFKEAKFTKEHRSEVWERLDGAFKTVKEKRFGSNALNDSSPSERLNRRYQGLITAISKMEKSIQRDKDDLSFQDRKIANSDGQLEAQIRQAKIKMIEERIRSKEEKLGEMMQTKSELEARIETQKDRDAKRAERERIEAARLEAKEKIADKIKQNEEARVQEDDKLSNAANAIKGNVPVPPIAVSDDKVEEVKEVETEVESIAAEVKEESLVEAISVTAGETMEDVVDTAKAIATVVADKVEDAVVDLLGIEQKDAPEEDVQEVNEALGKSPDATSRSEEE